MIIERAIIPNIQQTLFKGKALLMDPRQVGKTTLIESLLSGRTEKIIMFNGDEADVR